MRAIHMYWLMNGLPGNKCVLNCARSVAVYLTIGVLLIACSSGNRSGGGTQFTLNAVVMPEPNPDSSVTLAPAGPKQFENAEGVSIELQQAYLVVAAAALAGDCSSPDFSWRMPSSINISATSIDAINYSISYSISRAGIGVLNWLIPVARAHTETTPTQLGTPNVIDLLASDGQVLVLGQLAPPVQNYCGLDIQLDQADDDANYLPTMIDMVGTTVYVQGRYQLPGEADVSFEVRSPRALLPARRELAEALIFSREQRQQAATIAIHYQRWFDGVDMTDLASDAQQNQLLNNISAAVLLSQ